MYRLAILFLSYIISGHGLVRHTVDLSGFDGNGLDPVLHPRVEKEVETNPLWVLDLNSEDLDQLKLRVGSEKEEREFEFAVGGQIRAIERNQKFRNRVKKDDPTKNTSGVTENVLAATNKENENLKRDIIRTINKFVLSSIEVGDLVNEVGPSLTLNFKGPYTSATIRLGNKQWHYFIRPPSPLPAWFYTPHPMGGDVDIPAGIRNTFYKSLLHMLQMFLGFPI